MTAIAVGIPSAPVTMGTRSAVFTGVYGADFSSVKIKLPPLQTLPPEEAIQQTLVAFPSQGRPMLIDMGTYRLRPAGLPSIPFDCSPSFNGAGNRLATIDRIPGVGNHIVIMALDVLPDCKSQER